jgi:hypothetical protein
VKRGFTPVLAFALAGALGSSIAAGAESGGTLGWGTILEGGVKIQGTGQGNSFFVGPGMYFEKALGRRFDVRAEIFPAQLYRERQRPEADGPAGDVTVAASAACLLARYRWAEAADSGWFAEAGGGPFYAYSRPVPSGGTRGNFFDQVGVGTRRGRWTWLLRFVHVSNANIGPQRHRGNPGISFASAGMGWAFR